MKPAVSFRDAAAFRAWLARHHASDDELILRCVKVAHAGRGVTYREALDEALCFGWIDGVRRSLDDVSFTQRFTRRRARSAWSQVNIKRFAELKKAGRIAAPGQAAFDRRLTRPAATARPQSLDAPFMERLRADAPAWRAYQAKPPYYRRLTSMYVMEAKRPDTREKRFQVLFTHLRTGRPFPMLEKK